MKNIFKALLLSLLTTTFLSEAPPKEKKRKGAETPPPASSTSPSPSESSDDCIHGPSSKPSANPPRRAQRIISPAGIAAIVAHLKPAPDEFKELVRQERIREAQAQAEARRLEEIERERQAERARKKQEETDTKIAELSLLITKYRAIKAEFEGIGKKNVFSLWFFWNEQLENSLKALGKFEEYESMRCKLKEDLKQKKELSIKLYYEIIQRITSLRARKAGGDITPDHILKQWIHELEVEALHLKEQITHRPEYVAEIIGEEVFKRIPHFKTIIEQFDIHIALEGMNYLRTKSEEQKMHINAEYEKAIEYLQAEINTLRG